MPFDMRALTATLVLGLLIYSPAYAQQGVNSSVGTSLPIGAGGNTSVWVTPGGNVGIGTQNPQTTLDVNGGIRSGNGTIGTACPLEGVFGYDLNSHQLIYCNGNTIWTPIGGSASQSGAIAVPKFVGTYTANVLFARPFSSVPSLIVAPGEFDSATNCSSQWTKFQVSASNITTTGFTLSVYEDWPSACNESETSAVNWLATQ